MEVAWLWTSHSPLIYLEKAEQKTETDLLIGIGSVQASLTAGIAKDKAKTWSSKGGEVVYKHWFAKN